MERLGGFTAIDWHGWGQEYSSIYAAKKPETPGIPMGEGKTTTTIAEYTSYLSRRTGQQLTTDQVIEYLLLRKNTLEDEDLIFSVTNGHITPEESDHA